MPTHFLNSDFVLNDLDLVKFLPAPLAIATASASDSVMIPEDPQPKYTWNKTPRNDFGVFRHFTTLQADVHSPHITNIQQHDPTAQSDLSTMSDIPPQLQPGVHIYSPFPNKNTFLLSKWFWNHGYQKPKENFRLLLHIIGSPNFSPVDIANTNWDQLNHQLGINNWDQEEWQAEDAGWSESAV
ncbi:hypothetical protein DXG01_006522 [Tephrocybe rancida]|nr:hypothetical protein DXG01_006522 [Tephrocybe rancida]